VYVKETCREMDYYNLDIIIAIGYRVQSPVATRFRTRGLNAAARIHPKLPLDNFLFFPKECLWEK